MAQIKQIDLEFLSNDEIKNILKTHDVQKLPPFIKDYITRGDTSHDVSSWIRANRIHSLLNNIIAERFIDEKTYTRNDVIKIVRDVLTATGKDIKAEMKNINHNPYMKDINHNPYIEFSEEDLENWIEKNI